MVLGMVVAWALTPSASGVVWQTSPTHPHRTHQKANITHARKAYLGFDRNNYPGDATLPILRKTFSFCGYWLNAPPSALTDTWLGERHQLVRSGFGFLVLFNGRKYAEIQDRDPQALGHTDGLAAALAAGREGFPRGTIIFLDQEEGGRLLTAQRTYVLAWMDTVTASGFRPGIYCSGMPAVEESSGGSITTANNLRENSSGRNISFWVYNSITPRSPGCAFPQRGLSPAASGVPFAVVWQFAQSPAPAGFAGTRGYAADGMCYAPGLPRALHIHIDVDAAASSDPSHGRGSRDAHQTPRAR
jgi:hypothetical protein